MLLAFICSVLCAALSSAQNSSSTLDLRLTAAGNVNVLFRDNVTSAQLLATAISGPLQRYIVALPAGNSGSLVYFLAQNSNNLSVTIRNDSVSSVQRPYNNVGVQAELEFSANASMGVSVIGDVRAMRDYVEGAGTMHESQ